MTSLRDRAGFQLGLVVLTGLSFLQIGSDSRAQPLSGGPTVETFFQAIQNNDTNVVFRMLGADTNLTHALYYGRLPLHVAASAGNAAIVERLLRSGADINAESDTLATGNARLTALDVAVWYDHPGVCKLLLEAGANPNLLGYREGGALHLACIYKRTNMAKWLLDHGANPFLENQTVYDHSTPIELAITHGQGELVSRMLSLGSAAPAPAPRGRKARSAPEILADRGGAWLSAAAERGEFEAVEALLKAGVSARTNAVGMRPVLQAFALGEAAAESRPGFDRARWLRIRDLLINQGANYDVFAATAIGDLERARQLLAADKGVAQSRDGEGSTPLHWAVQASRLPLASFWIESGTPLAATNTAGQTALHMAAGMGKSEFASLLLAAQAPINIRDTNSWTPLDAAIQAKQSGTIHLLLAGKSTPAHPERGLSTSLHQAAASGNVAAVAALVETKTHLEARDELGLTPLQVAVQHGHLAAASLLVDKGADVNARDPEGNTLLLQVIPRYFGFSVVDRPPANWLDRVSSAPLKAACLKYLTVGPFEQGPHGIMQAASFLLASGIDVNATNRAGQTAFGLAADEGTALFDDREPLLSLLNTARRKP